MHLLHSLSTLRRQVWTCGLFSGTGQSDNCFASDASGLVFPSPTLIFLWLLYLLPSGFPPIIEVSSFHLCKNSYLDSPDSLSSNSRPMHHPS